MTGVCRDSDTAGGDLIPSQSNVYAEGELVIVDNDDVAPHGIGLHAAATMIATTTKVFVGGIAVCKQGNLATCGDPATGSSAVFLE